MKLTNSWLVIAAGLLFGIGFGIIILIWFPARTTSMQTPPGVGLAAENFTVDRLNGDAIKLEAYRGKPVVLNFWATWCPPCREEMPLFENFASRLVGEAVFIGMDTGEEDSIVQAFIEESGITIPIGMDRNGAIADLYYVNSFPVTFFIDPDGIVRAQHIGQLDEGTLKKYLATIGIKQ
jgi:cytochrome c biogenesis protein CcmG, thiol:disulfide interchange protein DsbE